MSTVLLHINLNKNVVIEFATVQWMFFSSPKYKKTFEDTKEEIRIRNLKDRQYNDQKKKIKWRNNDLQNITQKTKDQTTRNPLKPGGELRFSGRV